jgi:ATP-dependent Clp endopeptidase proteolytic subunit ClpP
VNRDAMRRSAQRITNLVQQPKSSWYRVIRNDAAGAATRVDIYDEIGGHWLFGGVSAVDFVNELSQIDGDIEVHINSPGGDVFDGLAIYNSLAQRPGKVTTIVDGLAASAASFIAMAGTQRLICPGAMMMIHEASGVCLGNAADMRETAELLDKVSGNLASIYADRSGRAEGWRDAMKQETWYTADEAVAAGLAHKVAERPAADALAAVGQFDLTAYLHAPRLHNADQAGQHGPFTGTHTHAHPAFGDQGGDASHEHEHTHDGDADHHHSHATENRAPGRLLGVESMPLTNEALPVHHTATVDEPWDGPAAVAAMPNDATVLRYCHAWEDSAADDGTADDPDGDADDKKASYKFPHHKTKSAPANVAACRNGLARLEGSSIPEADKAGVRKHLQAHLDDAHDGDDDGGTDNHAGIPGWLHNSTAPPPAWLNTNAEEAQ